MLRKSGPAEVRPELSINATGQKDRGLWGRECIDAYLPLTCDQALFFFERENAGKEGMVEGQSLARHAQSHSHAYLFYVLPHSF